MVASIFHLEDESGTPQSHPTKIAQIFHDYYSSLYNNSTVPHNPPSHELSQMIHSYLADCDLPRLSPSALTTLNSSITEEEITDTIKTLPNNKAPALMDFRINTTKLFYHVYFHT